MLKEYLDPKNLHHAYLVEGSREEIVPQVAEFAETLKIKNPDFTEIKVDTFKIEDARNMRATASEKSVHGGKRIILISANSFLFEAQNTLLKMFEDPIADTIFFLVVPDKNSLLKTLISRFFVISLKAEEKEEIKKAKEFLGLTAYGRIDFLKELLAESDEDDVREDSPRAKAINFLNALESVLHDKAKFSNYENVKFFEHIFKVRKFLRMPGSSAKNLMESVALVVPTV